MFFQLLAWYIYLFLSLEVMKNCRTLIIYFSYFYNVCIKHKSIKTCVLTIFIQSICYEFVTNIKYILINLFSFKACIQKKRVLVLWMAHTIPGPHGLWYWKRSFWHRGNSKRPILHRLNFPADFSSLNPCSVISG